MTCCWPGNREALCTALIQPRCKQCHTNFPQKWLLRTMLNVSFSFPHPQFGRMISISGISFSSLLVLSNLLKVKSFQRAHALYECSMMEGISQRPSVQGLTMDGTRGDFCTYFKIIFAYLRTRKPKVFRPFLVHDRLQHFLYF